MTAKGKVNASNVQVNDRIIIKIERNDAGLVTGWHESATKTGQDVLVSRVTAKFKATGRRGYVLVVAALESGRYMEPIQTMWLAPEDPAGVKRAYAEALVEDAERTRVAEVAALDARIAAAAVAAGEGADRLKAEREAGTYTTERFLDIVTGPTAQAPQEFLDTLPAYAEAQRQAPAQGDLDEATDATADAYWAESQAGNLAEAEAAQVENLAALPSGVQGGAWLADSLGITPQASVPALPPASGLGFSHDASLVDATAAVDTCVIPAEDIRYRVTFDRIGRRDSVAPMDFLVPAKTTDPADELAEAVWRYASKFLASRDFEVTVDLANMRVSIGWGRFGGGTIAVVPNE